MQKTDDSQAGRMKVWREFGRAAGGALVFSLPMLMTMEMWRLGFYMDRARLLVLIAATIPILLGLSRQVGFESTRNWSEDITDSAIALGIGMLVSLTALTLFGVITAGMSADEIVGKVAVQSVPAAIGALLARSQFGAQSAEEKEEREKGYGGELFLMAVGSLFLGLNVAPTEEMVLISYLMTSWHAIALVLLSLAAMHAFVFSVGFAGGTVIAPDEPWWGALVRITLPGYVMALAVSLALLWVFGRTDDNSLTMIVMVTVVLGLPSAIGAAAARLIL